MEHFVRGSSNEELKNKSEYFFNAPNKYTANDDLKQILFNQKSVYASNYNDSVDRAFKAIDKNKDKINEYSTKFNIPAEIIGGLILEEQYTQIAPDWSMVLATFLGVGEHSTGLGAIRPSTAKEAWQCYSDEIGTDFSEKLPKSDLEWSYKLASDEDFNLNTICLTLAMKAKEKQIISSYDELKNLTDEQWSKILYYYNGGGDHAKIYSKNVMEFLPYMKTYLSK